MDYLKFPPLILNSDYYSFALPNSIIIICLFFLIGYDWQSKKLDPGVMNVEEGEEESLPHLIQVSISLQHEHGETFKNNCSVEALNQWRKPSDFPSINPASSGTKNTYMYVAATSGSRSTLPHFPFDMIVKISIPHKSSHTWSTGARRFVGEPIFVPKGGQEDDGYLLVVEVIYIFTSIYFIL